ncbi:antiholin [Companilactobacillus sp. RD055328]|uniref:antiholin-like protein LrgB n=1 Tax=Companilactobacillus sp. RD055328 TaxID=2916634 RepID=UPI001FC7E8E1|nr:antiholin-like protein LrgB [Companilactobacillus sp. RD055328]GKQ42338.1 antiholin [Companilactobacillus sp. RD055328]
MTEVLSQPFFGICLSILVFLLGQYLFKKTKGFFLFQPLFFGMVVGILALIALASAIHMPVTKVYTDFYKPGGDIIFWFLNPATIAFAVPLYKRNDIVKKYWFEIFLSLLIGMVVSLILIVLVSNLLGLDRSATLAMMPQAATTAIALPISTAIGGNAAITAMTVILNAVIIYALGDYLIKLFKLDKSEIGLGLGLGTAGHTIGSAKALELGEIQGSMASISVIVIGIIVDIVVPIFARLIG